MNRLLRNRKIFLCGVIFDLGAQEIDLEKYKEARGLYIEDPWERVRSIFSKDAYGNFHPEMTHAIQMSQIGALMGFLFGALVGAKKSTDDFIRTNDTNIYVNKRQAYKELINKNTLGALKMGFRWIPPFALFFGTYSLISSCCQLYRNKFGVLENTIAGGSVGALSRFMFGFKGMISGGLVGSVFGTMYAFLLIGISKIGKTDQLELKYAQFAFFHNQKLKRKFNSSLQEEEIKNIAKEGLHVMHISNPLDQLDD